jgi:hypothetical protein
LLVGLRLVQRRKLFQMTNFRRICFLALLSTAFNDTSSYANLSCISCDIPLENLLSIGCSECEDSALTPSGNLTSCSGPYFFFGVKTSRSNRFVIGAYSLAEEAKKETLFDTHFIFEGTDLPLHSCHSGFLNESPLIQRDRIPDFVMGGTENPEDQGTLLHIAGASEEDLNNNGYRNYVYTCPTGIFRPSDLII